MSSSCSPIIVLVPGAFGTPRGFDRLVPHLDGLETRSGAYPSCNPQDPFNADCMQDISALRGIILSLLEQKRDLVLLAHSYGGVVAGGAAKGLDRETRKAQEYDNAVVGLIYVAGNIALENESLREAFGGAYPPFIKSGTPSEGLAIIAPAMDILYNDCDPSLEPEFDKFMNPHALQAFETKPSAPAWKDRGFDKRRLYVRAVKDQCLPYSLQTAWVEKSAVEWEVVDFETGHMPFVSQPEALGAQIVKFVRGLDQL